MRLGSGWLLLFVACAWLDLCGGARGGRRGSRRRSKGKSGTKFFRNYDDDSLHSVLTRHPNGAVIVKGTHWTQTFRLGFKILLTCIAEGGMGSLDSGLLALSLPFPNLIFRTNHKRVPICELLEIS